MRATVTDRRAIVRGIGCKTQFKRAFRDMRADSKDQTHVKTPLEVSSASTSMMALQPSYPIFFHLLPPLLMLLLLL